MKNKKLIIASLLALGAKCNADSSTLDQVVKGLSSGTIQDNATNDPRNLSEIFCQRIETLSLEELQDLLDSNSYEKILKSRETALFSLEEKEKCKRCLEAALFNAKLNAQENTTLSTAKQQLAEETSTPSAAIQPQITKVVVEDLAPANNLPTDQATGLLNTSSIEPKESAVSLKKEKEQPKVEAVETTATENDQQPQENISPAISSTTTNEEAPKTQEENSVKIDKETGFAIGNDNGQQ